MFAFYEDGPSPIWLRILITVSLIGTLIAICVVPMGCKEAKYHKGQYVSLNGARVRIINVDPRVSRVRYTVRHCGFSNEPDTGLLASGKKVTYAGTNVVSEWELEPLPEEK